MTIGLLLTLIFVAFNLAGRNDWPWYVLGLPMMIELALYVVWLVVVLCFGAWAISGPRRDARLRARYRRRWTP